MSKATRVRWGSFSLRTLLFLVSVSAVASAYVGYQLSIVRARQALLKELTTAGLQITPLFEAMQPMRSPNEPGPSVPLIRRWLGDEPIASIGYYPHSKPERETLARIKRLFPEAGIEAYDPPLAPCHPGCFPHGTLVETAAGPRSIEAIAVDDEVYSISPRGKKILLPVVSIFRTTNRLWIVKTSRGELRTTETQPLCRRLGGEKSGVFVDVGKVQPGEVILSWSNNGSPDGEIHEAEVKGKIATDEIVPVINLVLGNRETFIAGGFLARSKPPRDDAADVTLDQHFHQDSHQHEKQP